MGRECQVITARYLDKSRGFDAPVYSFDYSQLEVGDWFPVKGGARRRSSIRSFARNPTAKDMEFSWTKTGRYSWRVERTA